MLDFIRLRRVIERMVEIATAKEIDDAMKADINYWGVQSNSVQAIRRSLLEEVNSFFKALESWKEKP